MAVPLELPDAALLVAAELAVALLVELLDAELLDELPHAARPVAAVAAIANVTGIATRRLKSPYGTHAPWGT